MSGQEVPSDVQILTWFLEAQPPTDQMNRFIRLSEMLILGSQHLLHETGEEQARPEIQMGLKFHNTIGKLLSLIHI